MITDTTSCEFTFNGYFTPSSARDGSTPYILMDQYGQTPDHFYLATCTPRSAARINQVKRRLNMDLDDDDDDEGDENVVVKRRKRKCASRFPVTKARPQAKTDAARYDTSLGFITKKFYEIIATSPEGVLNLNRACSMLSVPKRRIYDITNVLEGAGLLEKTSRNTIQWKADFSTSMQSDIDYLQSKEKQLDELIDCTKEAIQDLRNFGSKYMFVTNEDLQSVPDLKDQTVIGIRAAPDTVLEAHEDFKISLKSTGSQILSYLLSDTAMEEVGTELRMDDAKNCDNEENNMKNEWIKKEEAEQDCDLESVVDGEEDFMIDPTLKFALIEEEDDLAPMGKNFLLQTDDQNSDSSPFLNLEPPLLDEDYHFILEDEEGISDLFDTCEFSST